MMKNNNKTFDTIILEDGNAMTQTRSGRVIKMKKANINFDDDADGDADDDDDSDFDIHDTTNCDRKRKRNGINKDNKVNTSPPNKKRKLSTSKNDNDEAKIQIDPNEGCFTIDYSHLLSPRRMTGSRMQSSLSVKPNNDDSENNKESKNKYQYPYKLETSMPDPDEADHIQETKMIERSAYTADKNKMKHCPQKQNRYKYCMQDSNIENQQQTVLQYQLQHQDTKYHEKPKTKLNAKGNNNGNPSLLKPLSPSSPSLSSSTNKKQNTMHKNRGFAAVIEQQERPQRKAIKTYWKNDVFIKQINTEPNIYDVSPEEIPLIFCDYLKSAKSIQYAIVDENDVYHKDSVLQLNKLRNYGPFSSLHRSEEMLGIQRPYVYLGQTHAFFPFHREDMNFFAVNHLLWGCDKLWYCVHPNDHHKVLEFVRQQYGDYCIDCLTPLQHKLFWFDPYILLSLGIKVFFIRQKVGDIVITPPGGIHGGLNTGPNLAESINFMTYDIETCWKPILSAMFYYMDNRECHICISHAFLDVNRLAKRLRQRNDHKNDEKLKELLPPTSVIQEPLKIDNKSVFIFDPDQYITRSFKWETRYELEHRKRFSNDFKSLLKRKIIYPYYEQDKVFKNKITVFPVEYFGKGNYCGVRPDYLRYDQVLQYDVHFLTDKTRHNERVLIKHILQEHKIDKNEWMNNPKFNDEQIKQTLIKIFDKMNNIDITFQYKEEEIKKTEKNKNSQCFKRNRSRVIRDSDTSDDDD